MTKDELEKVKESAGKLLGDRYEEERKLEAELEKMHDEVAAANAWSSAIEDGYSKAQQEISSLYEELARLKCSYHQGDEDADCTCGGG